MLSLMLNHVAMLPLAYMLLKNDAKPPPPPPVEVDLVDAPRKKLQAKKLQPPRLPKPKVRPKNKRPRLARLPPQPKKKLLPKKKEQPKKKPPEPPKKQQKLQPMPRLKMVEVNTPETKEPAKNARFLSDKNRRVLRQTRARLTNLIRDARKPRPTTERAPKHKRPGAKKKKIAELDKQRAKKIKPQSKQSPRQKVSPLLAMRRPAQKKRDNKKALTKRKALAQTSPDGTLLAERKVRKAQKARAARPRLSLTHRDFDRIFGAKARKARELARLQPSKRRGSKYTRRWKRVRAALENFVPEVRPGNQTALGTRAHPFALYIARMHRRIHKLWGFGFLVDLESKPDSHPFNNMNLWTMVEVVVAPSGKVAKVTIVKPSGQLAFDVAALNTVFTAGPFRRPPKAIRSKDGRVYMHWRFHRNHRQCGTFGVDPYILTKPPKGPIDGNFAEVGKGGSAARGRRRLNRTRLYRGGAVGGGASASARKNKRGRFGSFNQPRGRAGQRTRARRRRLRQAHRRHQHRHAKKRYSSKTARKAAAQAARAAAAKRVDAKDPLARKVATRFVDALRRRDAKAMAAQCRLPFYSRGRKVATTYAQLSRMFADITRERRGRVGGLQVMTVMQARRKLGHAPRGARYGAEMLVGRVKIGGAAATLLLRRKDGVWRVVALDR